MASQYSSGLNPTIIPQLAYYCAPLEFTNCWAVIPHYCCTASVTVTNPDNSLSTIHLMPTMIPATDDPTYVPSAILTASTIGTTQVVASVVAIGGLPPYSYCWGGSDACVSTNTGPNIAYTPRVRVECPALLVEYTDGTHTPTDSFVISWPYPSTGFVLEYKTDIRQTAWVLDTHGINVSGGMNP